SGKIVRIIEKGVIVELPSGVDGFVPASQLAMTHMKNVADVFHVGDELPLAVVEFDKDSKKIVLSAVEYLKGKEQQVIDEYVAKHKLPPMTLKDVANVSGKPTEAPPEGLNEQPPTSDFLI
ncbi:MAG TPA: S1 RNA-binding domain-containing protein, partial [Bacteroidota bacterium]|nr:S1 RNA-binding domain-containing protein [Bacteroidota bacterium]